MVLSKVFSANRVYSYKFDQSTGIGECVETGEKIYVVKDRTQLHCNAFKIQHDNSIKCLHDNSKDRHLVCLLPEKRLSTYIDEWKGNNVNSVMKFNLPYEDATGSSRKDGIEVKFLNSDIRKILHQMFQYVDFVHSLKYTMNAIKVENLWMEGRNVIFGGIEYAPLPKLYHHSKKKDFKNLVTVITELFGAEIFKLNSLKLLKSLSESLSYLMCGDGKLLAYHLAIIPHQEVISFITACGEKIGRQKYYHQTYVNVMKDVTVEDNWISDFADPKFQSVRNCFQKGSYDQTGRSHVVKTSLLRFARDLIEHFDLRFHMSSEYLEATVMQLFGEKLMETRINLAEKNKLGDFI